ncbi:hypothetical protein J5754_01765 [bacterium]|nr:hypothetical protein [bacterium]
MKKSLLLLALLITAGSLFGSIRAITPVPQSTSPSYWWYQRFLYDKEYVQENEVPLLFVGDSITELWMVDGRGLSVLNKYFTKAPYNALVAGYSADRTEHVIWRMENGELDGSKPKAVCLMIGTNNTWHYDESQEAPCDTVLGIRSCIDSIRAKAPKAKIFLFAILPCGRNGNDPRRARNAVVNDAMRDLCDGENVVFCEINNQVMDCNGYYGEDVSYDGVHLSTPGYQIWAKNLLKLLQPIFYPDETPEYSRPLSKAGEAWWTERLYQTRCATASIVSTRPSITFYGDDLAQGWEEEGQEAMAEYFSRRKVLNCGFDSDSLGQLIWRAKYANLSGMKTYNLVLQAGLIDTGITEEEFLDGYASLFAECRAAQPNARIIVMGLPPRGLTADDPMRARIEKINEGLKAFANGENVFYVDCNKELVDSAGNLHEDISPDQIHFTAKAYDIWAKALLDVLK